MNNSSILFLISFILFVLTYSCGTHTERDGIKYRQYVNEGNRLYIQHCSNCHQKDGSGLVRLYPPLENSNYFLKKPDTIICIIRNGLVGEILVNNISFNQPMPDNLSLTNLEIAEITTFLYSKWGKTKHFISPKKVEEILAVCP